MKASIAVNLLLGLGQLAYWQHFDFVFNLFGAGFSFGLAAAATVVHVAGRNQRY